MSESPDHPALIQTRDPVCGMTVDPSTTLRLEHDGTTYLFCNPRCLEKFRADPARYLDAIRGDASACSRMEPRAPARGDGRPAARGPDLSLVTHTCPMHPEVRQEGPGACPECGMALEPEEVSLSDAPDPEALDLRRRLGWAVLFTVPVVALAMAGHVPGLHALVARVPWRLSGLVQAALTAPVVLWAAWPFFVRGFRAWRRPNMFTLIGLGVAVSFLYSIAALLFPGVFPASVRGSGGEVGLYFESAAAIVTLVLVGQVLETRARGKTREALQALLRLQPPTAVRLRADGRDEEVPIARIVPGDRVRVRTGFAVPVDGVVESGACSVDEASVTGEPLPVLKGRGDPVVAGTVAVDGACVVRAERVGSATLLARIVRQVAEAQRTRAPIQGLADRVAAWFTPSVVVVAVVTLVAWLLLGPPPALAQALTAAVSVLVIACPCALGLATPVAVTVAMGRAARAGVLFRDARALQVLRDVDVLVVDKTGTLTEGHPRVREVTAAGDRTAAEVLRLAASVERGSGHPLARALVEEATVRGLDLVEAADFRQVAGQGVEGEVEGRRVAVGTPGFLASLGVSWNLEQGGAPEGLAVAHVVVDGKPAGVVAFEDPIRPTTPEAVRGLKAEGVRLVMVTGDASDAARVVARTLGVDEVVSGASPLDKMAVVERLRAEGHVVAVAGDGVNDAPALARADVGIAMGTGADIAMQSAPVTLVRGDLRAILRARRLSRLALRTVRQNLFLAFAYNALAIPVAAGVLSALFRQPGLLLTPAIAAAAMSFSSVSVITNSLRLAKART